MATLNGSRTFTITASFVWSSAKAADANAALANSKLHAMAFTRMALKVSLVFGARKCPMNECDVEMGGLAAILCQSLRFVPENLSFGHGWRIRPPWNVIVEKVIKSI